MSAHPRLSLNLATIRHATLDQAIATSAAAGIGSLGVWRHLFVDVGAARAGRMMADAGLDVSGLYHSAPLCELDPVARARAHEKNLRAIEEAAELWSAARSTRPPTLTLVAGGLPAGSRDLAGARERARDAVGELTDAATAAGVRLGVEPFHPVLAADRGVIASLAQALALAEDFDPSVVGIVLDSWHVWWESGLARLVARAGDRVFGVQIADWLPKTPLARGMPGDGVIDFEAFLAPLTATGYDGPIEVEIFNPAVWDAPIEQTTASVVSSFSDALGLLTR